MERDEAAASTKSKSWAAFKTPQISQPTPCSMDTCENHTEAIMQCRNTFESHIALMGERIRAPRCQVLLEGSKQERPKAALNGKRM